MRAAACDCGPLLAPLLLLLAGSAQAARPMATDDTATAPAGECQIEAWGERDGTQRAQVLAPACGLTDSLELDAAASRVQGGDSTVSGLALGLKWVPAAGVFDTALGTVRLGVLGGVFWARDPGGGWKGDELVLVALSSLEFAPSWNLYANVVTARNVDTGKHVNGLRTALAWQPDRRWLLFVEGLRYSDSSNLRNAGFRFWAMPDVLGLDVVTTRSVSGGFSVSVGFGWYGLRLP